MGWRVAPLNGIHGPSVQPGGPCGIKDGNVLPNSKGETFGVVDGVDGVDDDAVEQMLCGLWRDGRQVFTGCAVQRRHRSATYQAIINNEAKAGLLILRY